MGEQFRPGPVGRLRRDEEPAWHPSNRFVVWVITLLGIGIFSVLVWQLLQWDKPWEGVLLLSVYLLLAWLFSPRPDTSNMGWFGGLLNNPFRISDNVNRWLLFFALFLLPGKLVLYAFQILVNTFRLL